MTRRLPDSRKAETLRDLAVLAVARRGAMERSGAANLAVLREDDLMIGYHTPFNPLPKLAESAKYDAALKGRDGMRDTYGIDVWLEAEGKVFSAGWTPGGQMHVRLCKPGAWQARLLELAAPSRSHQRASAPEAARNRKLRRLEQENRNLRRAISGLMLDKLILTSAAAGKL